MISEIFSELSLKYSIFLALFIFVVAIAYGLEAKITNLERQLQLCQKQLASITKPVCIHSVHKPHEGDICTKIIETPKPDLKHVYDGIDSIESFCAETNDSLTLTNKFLSSLIMGLFSYACSPNTDPAFSRHIVGAFNGETEEVLFIQEYIAQNYPYPLVKYLTDIGAVNWNTDDESVQRIVTKKIQNEKVYNYLTKILKRRG